MEKFFSTPYLPYNYTEFDERFLVGLAKMILQFHMSWMQKASRKGITNRDGGATVTFTWEEDDPTGISVYKQQKEGTKRFMTYLVNVLKICNMV